MADTPAKPGRGRSIVFLIAALSIAPILAASVIYYFFPQQPAANYGTLLPIAPAAPITGTRADG